MGTFTLIHDHEVDAPAEQAWTVIADYRRDVEWRAGVVAMEPTPSGPVGPGTTTAEEMRLAGRTYRNDGVVLDVRPGVGFDWRTTQGAKAEGSRTVVPLGPSRCRVVLELRVTPTGATRLMAPVLRRMLDRGLSGDVRRLAALVEAEHSEHPVPTPSR
jgi:hypothetical protein